MFVVRVFIVLAAISSVFAHPVAERAQKRDLRIVGRTQSAVKRASSPELDALLEGNKKFRENIEASDPGLLKKLTDEGQEPPFLAIGCSDSRVSESLIFDAKPGTLFTQRNIANQYHSTDPNAQSVLSYGITELGVKHVMVIGHYGCGGVAAAIATPPTSNIDAAGGSVQAWISSIREIYETSTRPEIVELREKNKNLAVVEEPEVNEPGFRALVEENVKASVRRILADSVITNHFARLAGDASSEAKRDDHGAKELHPVYVHGVVYDIENGEIHDLGISTGPPGKEALSLPFEAVAGAALKQENLHTAVVEPPRARCEKLCQAKRSLSASLPW